MPDCECLSRCPFFNDRMVGMPGLASQIKRKYCRGNFDACARFQILKAAGRDFIPADLFPDQLDRLPALLGLVD